MPFLLNDCLVSSETISQFMYGVADATTLPSMTPKEKWLVEMCAEAASAQIKTYCGRNLTLGTFAEVWDGQENDTIICSEYPIREVVSLKLSPSGDFTGAPAIDPRLYFARDGEIYLRNILTPRGRGMVQVNYRAGFDPVPKDLQFACIRQLQYLFQNQGKTGDVMTGLKTVTKQGETAVKDDQLGKTGLIADVIGMVSQYRRLDAPLSVMFARVN